MKKIIIGLFILVLLLIGAVIFIATHKKGIVGEELPTNAQIVTEAVDPSESTSLPKVSSTETSPKTQKVVTQKTSGSVTATNTIQPRTTVSGEDCKKWQMARNAAGVEPVLVIDGICSPEKSEALYQEYLATRDQYTSQSSTTTTNQQPPTPHYEMQTYTNSEFGFSFEYPKGMICEKSSDNQNSYNPDYWKFRIGCGNKNLDGGRADYAGGSVFIYLDSGSSEFRSTFRSHATESGTRIIGSNKFYPGSNGWTLEKPTYLLIVTSSLDGYVPPSHIDLTSLRFQ